MKNRTVIWVSSLFLLSMFSCDENRHKPECWDASCCNPDYNEYVEYLQDIPAEMVNGNLFLPDYYPRNWQIRSRTFLICTNSMEKVKPFADEISPWDYKNPVYRYRVSGKLLVNVKWQTLTANPMLSFYIDKIEKVSP